MSGHIDYESIDVPDNKQYEEWSYAQRRAYILSEIHNVGHPKLLHQAEIARQFDVDRSTVHRDVSTLAEYVAEHLGNRRTFTTEVVLRRCIEGLLAEGEYRKAAQTVLEWNEWVAREADLTEMKEQLAELLEERHADGQRHEDEDSVEVALTGKSDP